MAQDEKPPWVPVSRIGFNFAASVLGFLALGWVIDRALGSEPWGLLGMLVVGFSAGVAQVWRALNEQDDKTGDKN